MRFIILIVLIICSIQKIRAWEYTVKLQQVEVIDSAMFDAVIETMQSDSLQAWVKEYHYPNRDARLKNFKYTKIGFSRYESDYLDTTFVHTTITYAQLLHDEYYTIYKNRCIYITNFPDEQTENLKYIKPINKFKTIKMEAKISDIHNFVILVFNYINNKLHICRNKIDWIITLE